MSTIVPVAFRKSPPVNIPICRGGMKVRKHLRRCAWLCKYSMRFADHATLPYGLGRIPAGAYRLRKFGF